MENFAQWWESLSIALKIYWCLAVPATLFFLLQLIFSFLGADSPDDVPDAEIESDTGIGFQFFTWKNLVAFFTIFGWTGIVMTNGGYSDAIALLVAILAGVVMMTMMAGIFYLLSRATADGTLRLADAIGKTGEVYLTVPARKSGIGKVQVTVGGSLRTLDAMTDDTTDIPTGRVARVVGTQDTFLLITTN